MKILFITANGIDNMPYGGPKGSIRNYLTLKKYGEVIVYHIHKKSNLKSLLSIFQGYFPPINRTDENALQKIKNQQIDLVFWDGSCYGNLVDIFHDKKNIVFFHNCEYDYINIRFKRKPIKRFVYQKIIYKNERLISEKADYRIAFSKRDKSRISELYNVNIDQIIPLGIADSYQFVEPTRPQEPVCLLLGAMCEANTEGYQWFINQVSPYIHCKTVIAGKGYEKFRQLWENEKVKVKGFVDNLPEIYERASLVAIPLWSGGGMKVKTVEALMYGKTIFGTDEAFSGFDANLQEVGVLCNSDTEFIDKINTYLSEDRDRFNEKARQIYLSNYSIHSTDRLFDQVMKDLDCYK